MDIPARSNAEWGVGFERLARIAAKAFDTPMAVVSRVEETAQGFFACQGLASRPVPLEASFCNRAVVEGIDLLVVEDATADPRFARYASVTGDPGVRFYAGAVFRDRSGRAVGAVAVIDTRPRPAPAAAQLETLTDLAALASDLLEEMSLSRESQERLSTLGLAESVARVGHWRFEVANSRLIWSDEVFRIHGHEPGAFDPSLHDAIGAYHPDDRDRLTAAFRRAVDEGVEYALRLRLVRADGAERITEARGVAERGEDGRTTAVFGVFQDVTEAAQAQASIAESEARWRMLADNATDIIATYTPEGVITWVSPTTEVLLGHAPEALVGDRIVDHLHPDDIAPTLEAFRAYVDEGPDAETPVVTYRAITRDGEERWLEARPRALWRDGQVAEFQDFVRDVTQKKAMEADLVEARDQAEAAARAKDEFLTNMSHELRTPLTSVIGFAGLLQASETLGPMERRCADRISTASEALLSVINDILDYSKLEAGAVEMDPQPFALGPWAEGAIGLVEGQCGEKGLALTLAVEPEDGIWLVGDEGRLRQVLLNFLSNACKFTAEGGVSAAICTEPDEMGARLRVAVTDSGVGVAEDRIEALFDRFTQADQSTTRTFGGTGLGLAISKRLIEMMGGRIGVTSRPGEGSTFWFEVTLPIARGEVEAGEAPPVEAVPPGARILLVDDAPANRELVGALLAGLGLEVETADDGAEGVAALRRGRHDLVLMDVQMPGMDGLTATRAIRALDEAVATTPIIALTANVRPEHVARCREAGMDDHVPKPVSPAELAAAINRQLTRPETVTEAARRRPA